MLALNGPWNVSRSTLPITSGSELVVFIGLSWLLDADADADADADGDAVAPGNPTGA